MSSKYDIDKHIQIALWLSKGFIRNPLKTQSLKSFRKCRRRGGLFIGLIPG